ncbi:MAG: hypothetical protein HY360_02835 [Verrucomicrobia bacterium]|nr:hypothetical protein [Verrucomicrobiota bacterium]
MSKRISKKPGRHPASSPQNIPGDSPKRMVYWEATQVPGLPRSPDEFRRFAERAAAAGVTHIALNDIPKSRWQRGDARDPHPEWEYWTVWSRPAIGIFKLVLPSELEPWIPKEEVERNMAMMEERCAILRSLELRATLDGHEPMWWPEGAFQSHPRWRGPEVQLPTISRVPYHSPCLDQPEVLAMYRRAMQELCRRLPEVDSYSMLTNDSSAGICWSHTYPGKNGPRACRKIALIDRVTGFMDALQEGARAAGREIAVNLFNCGFWVDGHGHYRASLKAGQYIDGMDREGRLRMSGTGRNGWFGGYVYPVLGIPQVMTFLEELERAFASGAQGVGVSVANSELLLTEIFTAFQEKPSTGPASRMDILRRVASQHVGAEHAEGLLEIWLAIERATENVRYGLRGSPMMIVGPLMSRWIIMPMVPDVYRLTDDEKRCFQRGRVAKNEIEALDYGVFMGERAMRGETGVNHVRLELLVAIDRLEAAAASAEAMAGRMDRPQSAQELKDLARRLKVLASVYLTCRNFIEYAHILATRKTDEEHVVVRDIYQMSASMNRGRWELCALAREEMDNALALAELVEAASEPVLAMAPTMEEEDGLAFAPNLAEQLRKKASIMMAHWREFNELYPHPLSPPTRACPPDLDQPGLCPWAGRMNDWTVPRFRAAN